MNWQKIIDRAERRGGFSVHFIKKSSGWFSCACVNIDRRIKRWESGAPKDSKLSMDGVHFCGAVCRGDFKDARRLLAKIEARERVLLKELGINILNQTQKE